LQTVKGFDSLFWQYIGDTACQAAVAMSVYQPEPYSVLSGTVGQVNAKFFFSRRHVSLVRFQCPVTKLEVSVRFQVNLTDKVSVKLIFSSE